MSLYKFAGLRNALSAVSRNAGARYNATSKKPTPDIPEKPKKPLSAYFRFLKDYRHQSSSALKTTEVVKNAATEWAKVDPKIKNQYAEAYKKEVAVYQKELEEYNDHLTPSQILAIEDEKNAKAAIKQKRDLKKRIREAQKPKRPLTPYMLFLVEQPRMKDETVVQRTQRLKGLFHELSAEERAAYERRYEASKKLYERDLDAWEQKMLSAGQGDLVRKAVRQSARSATDARSRTSSK